MSACNTEQDKAYHRNYWRQVLKRQPGEGPAHRGCKRTPGTVRSHAEVASILGVSTQAVQRTERRIFHKVRVALMPHLKEVDPVMYRRVVREFGEPTS